jgi:DNA-binding transcriptional ArsR family regulator
VYPFDERLPPKYKPVMRPGVNPVCERLRWYQRPHGLGRTLILVCSKYAAFIYDFAYEKQMGEQHWETTENYTYERLEREASTSDETIRRALDELEELGIVSLNRKTRSVDLTLAPGEKALAILWDERDRIAREYEEQAPERKARRAAALTAASVNRGLHIAELGTKGEDNKDEEVSTDLCPNPDCPMRGDLQKSFVANIASYDANTQAVLQTPWDALKAWLRDHAPRAFFESTVAPAGSFSEMADIGISKAHSKLVAEGMAAVGYEPPAEPVPPPPPPPDEFAAVEGVLARVCKTATGDREMEGIRRMFRPDVPAAIAHLYGRARGKQLDFPIVLRALDDALDSQMRGAFGPALWRVIQDARMNRYAQGAPRRE